VAREILLGDRQVAGKYLGWAKGRLKALKRRMAFGNRKLCSEYPVSPDEVKIFIRSSFGHDLIRIEGLGGGKDIYILFLITIAKPRNTWEMRIDELGNSLYKVYTYKITSNSIEKINITPVITYDATGLQLVAQFGSDMNHVTLSNYFTHEEEIGRLHHPLYDTPDKNSMWGETLSVYDEARMVGSSMAQKSLTSKLLASTQSRHNFSLNAEGVIDYKEFSIVRNLLGTVEMKGKLEWFNPDDERYLYQYNVTAKKIITGQEDEDVNTVVLTDTRTDSYNWLYHVPIIATKFNEVLARKVLGNTDDNPCSDSHITESLILGGTVIDIFNYYKSTKVTGYSIGGPDTIGTGNTLYELIPADLCDGYFWGSHPGVTIGADGLVNVDASACGYFTLNATCGTPDGGCTTVTKTVKLTNGHWTKTGGCNSGYNPGGLQWLYWSESVGYTTIWTDEHYNGVFYKVWAWKGGACEIVEGWGVSCTGQPLCPYYIENYCCYVFDYSEHTWGC